MITRQLASKVKVAHKKDIHRISGFIVRPMMNGIVSTEQHTYSLIFLLKL